MSEAEPIRVAVVEDDRRTRDGLCMLLDATAVCRCVGAFRSVEEALASRAIAAPEVLLLDIQLPGESGSRGLIPLREKWPQVVTLMLTALDSDERVLESLCNGAIGYLLKRTSPAKLIDAIVEAHHGGSPMSPEIASQVIRLLRKTVRPRIGPHLTPQELRVVALLAEGASYQAAGEELGVSINTVRKHIRAIYEKLHVTTRSEAVSKALRGGLL